MRTHMLIVTIVPAIFLFCGALVEGPQYYEYIGVLRIIVCAGSVFVALHASSVKIIKYEWIPWIFWGIAVLFNPIVPAYFPLNMMRLINMVSAAVFVVYFLIFNKHAKDKGFTK